MTHAPIRRVGAGARMSGAVVHAGVAYLSGQIALDAPDAGAAAQTANVLRRIDALLGEVGADKSRILSASIWLTDMGDFAEMNRVWDAWVAPGAAPARATVGAALALPGLKVEIAVIAALP